LAAVDDGVVTRPPEPHHHYHCFIDAAGGAGKDSFAACICHQDNGPGRQGFAVVDALFEKTPPFSPRETVTNIAFLCKQYRVRKIEGDRYAGEWPVEAFARHNIGYEQATHSRSEIYVDCIPLFTSGRVRLLDSKRLVDQFAGLRRKVQPGGREHIDHLPQAHDDLSNACAGALLACLSKRQPMVIDPRVVQRSAMIRTRPTYGGDHDSYGGGFNPNQDEAGLRMLQQRALHNSRW
jgi:hypothetical protein